MYLQNFLFLSVLLMFTEGLTVTGPSGPLVVPLGGSVLLPCSVDELLPLEDLEVEWKRSDSLILIHLYQEGDIRPEVQHENFFGRAFFFTDDIKRGNFSLLLKNVRKEDEGNYTCSVHSGEQSGEAVIDIKDVERLIVSGSDHLITAYEGEDVTLNCSVDSHISPEDIEEVVWKKTDKDEHILILLYEQNEVLPDSSNERYRDRVEFFTDEIPRGNFSLRLKRVRTEDKGLYMCQVFAGTLSANTTVILGQLGFSSLHIFVMILCISACGSAVLLCFLIYFKNTDNSGAVWTLQISLVICPNFCVFLAFIIWGVIEGFVNETVTCCSLYVLRPVMLIWAVRYLKYLQGNHKAWIRFFSVSRELALLTIIVYSVFFACGWKNSAHDASIERRELLGLFYSFVVLLCFMKGVIQKSVRNSEQSKSSRQNAIQVTGWLAFLQNGHLIVILSVFQMMQITYSFGLLNLALFSVPGVHILIFPAMFSVVNCIPPKFKVLKKLILLPMMVLDTTSTIFFHLVTLEREKDCVGWMCVISFIQALKMIIFLQGMLTQRNRREGRRTTLHTEIPFPLCSVIMYMFGAVGLVLLNSAALMTELILKARNGDRVIEDLRVIVFPSECVFAFYWLLLEMHAFWTFHDTEAQNQINLPLNLMQI